MNINTYLLLACCRAHPMRWSTLCTRCRQSHSLAQPCCSWHVLTASCARGAGEAQELKYRYEAKDSIEECNRVCNENELVLLVKVHTRVKQASGRIGRPRARTKGQNETKRPIATDEYVDEGQQNDGDE